MRAFAAGQAQAPLVAARAYCAALARQRYDTAYNLLTPSARAGATAAQWAADARLRDTVDGRVTRCTPIAASRDALTSFRDDLGITTGTLTTIPVGLAITRSHLGPRTGSLTLLHQNDAWRIKTVSSAVQGTTLGPLKTVQAFCQALAAGDFQQAYTYLSARQVKLEQNAAAFARQAAPPTGAKYAGCALDYATYRAQAATASLTLALNIAVTTASGTATVAVHGVASFVLERGLWKLDGLDLGTLSR